MTLSFKRSIKASKSGRQRSDGFSLMGRLEIGRLIEPYLRYWQTKFGEIYDVEDLS